MGRRIVRLALVPALLLSVAPATGASALYCGIRYEHVCRRVCATDPAVQSTCDAIDPPPGARHR